MEPEGLRCRAAANHGLLRTCDLEALGISERVSRRWQAEGWLVPVRRGVLAVGGQRPTPWQEAVAAVMVAGKGAALSHTTAARAHHLYCAGAFGSVDTVELSVRRPGHPRLAGCRVHRVVRLAEHDTVRVKGVPVTSPVRTLADMAPQLTLGVLERTIDEGLIAGVWTEEALGQALAGPRFAGVARLRSVLGSRVGPDTVEGARSRGFGIRAQPGGDRLGRRIGAGPLRSSPGGGDQYGSHNLPLQDRAVRVLAPLGPFQVEFPVTVGGHVYLIDLAWEAYKVAVECDGWTVRSRSRGKFDGDRRRNNALTSDGWAVVHLTSAMSDDEMRAAVFNVLLIAAAR